MKHILTIMLCVGFLFSGTAQPILVPADQPTIQEGLNTANFGDTVLVAPGTYYENITWPNVNGIKLIAEGDTSDTFIDGSQAGRVVDIRGQLITTETTIQGFTIKNGRGIGTPNASGVLCDSSSVIMRECRIMENVGQIGVGLGLVRSSTELHRCSIEKNYGTCPDPSGIGIFVFDSSFVIIDSCEIVNNLTYSCVDIKGVGIYMSKYSTVNMTNSSVSYNKGDVDVTYGEFNGVGIFSYFSSSLYISESRINNNQAVGNAQTALGTALTVRNGVDTRLEDVVISGNQSDAASEWSKGIVYCSSNSAEFNDVSVTANTVEFTSEEPLSTALIEIAGNFSGKNIRIRDNIIDFQNSQANVMGGLIRYSGAYSRNNFSLENSLVVMNNTINLQSGNSVNGVLTMQNCNADITNSTIAGNLENIQENSVSATLDTDTSYVSIVNTILWNPNIENELLGENLDVSHSNIQGGFAGFNTIDADPMFIGNGDYRLQTFSPCINSGTIATAPDTDIEGNPRPMPIGTNPDMGAYEDDNPSTSIRETTDSENLSIYPNPTDGFVQISSAEKIESVQVFNAMGKLVAAFSQNEKTIDLSDLPNGVYSLVITSEKRKLTEKLVLSK